MKLILLISGMQASFAICACWNYSCAVYAIVLDVTNWSQSCLQSTDRTAIFQLAAYADMSAFWTIRAAVWRVENRNMPFPP